MAHTGLSFLLMGKTGHGKSKTGNSLLDRRKAFIVSSSTTSETKEVSNSFAEFDNYRLTVVDGPGLEDTDITNAEDKETAAANMAKALGLCDGGVDAFLFVTKFGSRFTEEERSALKALNGIFGADYMKHVIVVMTAGDLFEQSMEDEECKNTFDEWCQKQKGPFQQLYHDCQGRIVLVNNFEKDEQRKQEQKQKIVQLTVDLKNLHGRYTSKSFHDAKTQRDRMIVEHKAPELGRQIQEKASLLSADIERLPKKPSDSQRANIIKRIQDLKNEIIEQDKGTGVLDVWMKHVEEIEHTLHNVEELHRLGEQLENLRKDREKSFWDIIKPIITFGISLLFE